MNGYCLHQIHFLARIQPPSDAECHVSSFLLACLFFMCHILLTGQLNCCSSKSSDSTVMQCWPIRTRPLLCVALHREAHYMTRHGSNINNLRTRATFMQRWVSCIERTDLLIHINSMYFSFPRSSWSCKCSCGCSSGLKRYVHFSLSMFLCPML